MEATGMSFETVRSLTPEQVAAVTDGIGQVRTQRAGAIRRAQEQGAK